MAGFRMCGLADDVLGASAGGLCKWTKSSLTYRFDNAWPMLPAEDVARAFRLAFDRWSAVSNIRFTQVGSGAADITIYSRRMDGPSNVLAEAELQCPAGQRALWTRFDNSEAFIVADNPPSNKVSLIAVACHEIGHLLGIGHLPANSGALMAPMYDPRVNAPKAADIAEAVARYGLPIPDPTPTPDPGPTPVPPSGDFATIRIPKEWVTMPS